MRVCFFIIAALLCIALFGWSFSNIEAASAPEVEMIISMPDGVSLMKQRVMFPHARHKKLDGSFFECTYCHHKWDQKSDPKKCTSSGCHDLVTTSAADKQKWQYFRNAFHSRKDFSCNGCHGLRKKDGKSHGPTSCSDCHRHDAP